MTSSRRGTASLVTATAMVALLAACGGDSDDDGGATPQDEATETENTETQDASDTIEVQPTGDGPIGLTTAGTPAGEAASVSGKLIVGPGGCLSMTADRQPELVVFEDGAEFTLRGDRPSVTTDDLGTVQVGEPVELTAVSVDRADISGIPQRCSNGTADTVVVVTG
ncbi:hypothetical protein JL108_16990 [Aeromicrobium sp. YIM 150415]|uniref:hypothetical protein n=1 Tax=Aeromicrobium sp. YIM 150415 TaxID=2803912 RepID=UPI0019653B7A|nr:hypothetical protein [Aeromicrobium sp. YIM 150415]MBM9465147.1 hypothetical protein [Aeromicrobium sp. YIM 150415]